MIRCTQLRDGTEKRRDERGVVYAINGENEIQRFAEQIVGELSGCWKSPVQGMCRNFSLRIAQVLLQEWNDRRDIGRCILREEWTESRAQ